MKIIAKWGFAFRGIEYIGGRSYEVEADVYEEIKSDVTIVETVAPKLKEARNTAQKVVITKEVKTEAKKSVKKASKK